MSIESLRRLVAKHYGSPCVVSDYDVHSVVVQACRSRHSLIELVQKELDRRYHQHIKQFQLAKTTDAVAALWRATVADGNVQENLTGAVWASLTHPRADNVLRTQISQDIHMIQHSVGDFVRRDAKALAQAQKTNTELQGELDSARTRLLKVQTQATHQAHAMQQQLAEGTAALVGVTAQNTALKLALEQLRQSIGELESREKLSHRVADLSGQIIRLKQQLADAIGKKVNLPSTDEAAAVVETVGPQAVQAPAPSRVINLHKRSVLCVGGRSSAVVSYRQAVERAGGRFIHHDGGLEHNHHRLDANLAAADCVVCQTACISHNAYWLVKDHCKKTGKTCVYLDKPSVSTFVEGLCTLPFGESSASIEHPAGHA